MKVFSYLAAGRAILGPTLPDLQEILVHDQNAWLVPPDNAARRRGCRAHADRATARSQQGSVPARHAAPKA